MKVSKSLMVVLFLIFTLSATVMAQNSPGQFLTVYSFTVYSGAGVQFEEYIKKIKEGAEKVGAPQTWRTFQIAFGGPGNTYLIGLQFDKWGELDAWNQVPEILEEAYGADEAAKILAKWDEATDRDLDNYYDYLSIYSDAIVTTLRELKIEARKNE